MCAARPEPPPVRRPNVLSIPPGVPFLDTLVEALLDGGLIEGVAPGRDPLLLADTTVFLPTQRAAQGFEAILMRRLGGATLLPRIAPLGDPESDDDFAFRQDELGVPLPEAADETERRLILTELIRAWARQVGETSVPRAPGEPLLIPSSPADAAALAMKLAQLIDSFETENVPWTELIGLVPNEHDESWSLIRDFLTIAAGWWTEHLRTAGQIGPAERRRRQIVALAERFRFQPPRGPLIVAGSTGSNPATAILMHAIARARLGAVVLPALDYGDLDAASWDNLAGDQARNWTHPQHGLRRLLNSLGVERGEVAMLGTPSVEAAMRRKLVAEALRPAETTDLWAERPRDQVLDAALKRVEVVAAANEREEAAAVALILREALETPDKTVALITPDRELARRVSDELKRWGVAAEDSSGRNLSNTPAGVLSRLLLALCASDFGAADLLALLAHPLCTLGLDAETLHRGREVLEIAALRGPKLPAGCAALRKALAKARTEEVSDHAHPARRHLSEADFDTAERLLQRLDSATAPLCALMREQSVAFSDLLAAHRRAAIAVGVTAESSDALFAAHGGGELRAFFDETEAAENGGMTIRGADYPALVDVMFGWRVVRPQGEPHPRLSILGSLEARLLGFDRVVLGGLIEGTWPAETRNDPWLSRPMRAALGLPPPEWRTGLAAHDFESALGNGEVFLTHALKAGGAPTVPSRWLQRLKAVSGAAWAASETRGERWLVLARQLDRAAPQPPLTEPRPTPPRHLRPKRLSVTEVETLIRDPYTIYARHVLNLRPLEPLAAPPGAADRGTIVHGVLQRFLEEKIDPAAPDALERLVAFGDEAFAPLFDYPDVQAIWLPRFRRIAEWFVGWERNRRAALLSSHSELYGRLTWTTAEGRSFMLTGKADRLDVLADGSVAIVDYKTGTVPSSPQVASGLAPQLPLEAAMLAGNGFAALPHAAPAERLLYVRLGGGNPAGEEKPVILKDGPPVPELAQATLNALKALIDRFEDEATPYRALIHPMFRRRPNGDYDHLARIAEWAIAAETEGSEP